MKPFPQARHLIAVLLFTAVSALSAYLATLDRRLSSEQTGIATAAIKRYDPDLMRCDPIFGESDIWRVQTPLCSGLLEMVFVPTGYENPSLPFRIMTGILVMIYLCGMYGLLYHQCQSWSVSAYVSILSLAVIETFGRWTWGIGSLASITPLGVVQALSPLIVLSFLNYMNSWRVLLVFAFIGICGNIHLAAAMNLAIILVTVFLAVKRFKFNTIILSMGCLLCAFVTASPYLAYLFMLRSGISGGDEQISSAIARHAYLQGGIAVLYPSLLHDFAGWLIPAGILILPALGSLLGVERFKLRDVGVWMWFLLAAIIVAFVFHGASQLIGALRGKAPPVIGFLQASGYAMLPLYVLFAQALTYIFRIARTHRWIVFWASMAFMVVWLLPADNARGIRHAIYESATGFMDEKDKPQRVRDIHEDIAANEELMQICNWAREKTDINAMFIVDNDKFRMFSRRSILASSPDVEYVYHAAPGQLEQWSKRLDRQTRAIKNPNPEELKKLAMELAAKPYFSSVSQWYVLLKNYSAPSNGGPLREQSGNSWGKHWRVFRIRLVNCE